MRTEKVCIMKIGDMRKIIEALGKKGLSDDDYIDFKWYEETFYKMTEKKDTYYMRMRFIHKPHPTRNKLDNAYSVMISAYDEHPKLHKIDMRAKVESTNPPGIKY